MQFIAIITLHVLARITVFLKVQTNVNVHLIMPTFCPMIKAVNVYKGTF
jgi:hypothetical protein